MDPAHIAWAAGLFEGEGCISSRWNTQASGNKYEYPRLQLGMTDEDVVQRFHEIVGVGHRYITQPKTTYKKTGLPHKEQYHWLCTKSEDIVAVLDMFMPYLGTRRLAKAQYIQQLASTLAG